MSYRIVTNGTEFRIQRQRHVHILWWMWTWWETKGRYYGDMECLQWEPITYKTSVEAEKALRRWEIGYHPARPVEQWRPVERVDP